MQKCLNSNISIKYGNNYDRKWGINRMSDQSQFIKEAFYLIKNSFEEFRNIDISLETLKYDQIPEEHGSSLGFVNWEIVCEKTTSKNQIRELPKTKFKITCVNDIENYSEEEPTDYYNMVENIKLFFETNGIVINEHSILLETLLHEFGHIYHMLHWTNFSDIEDYIDLEDINDSYILTIKRHNAINNNIRFNRLYRFGELGADQFKFEHFMMFWKLLGKITLNEFRSIQSICGLICHFNIDSNIFDSEGREYLKNVIGIADEDIRLILKFNTTIGRDLKPLIEFI